MIWLTLRQFRVQAAAAATALAALAAVLAVTGPGMADDYASGLAVCKAQGDCNDFQRLFFQNHESALLAVTAIVLLMPGLLGLFWGAPLVSRELEAGTHRLAWNQGVTRARWLTVKLVLVGAAAMVVAGLTVLAIGWWSDPIDQAAFERAPRLAPPLFGARGIVPVAYAAFAFTLGVTVGVVVRRALPTMAITLAVFAAVQVAVPLWVRPHLIPPTTATVEITRDNVAEIMITDGERMKMGVKTGAGSWTLTNHTVDASGRKAELPASLTTGACAPPPPGSASESGSPRGPGQECFDAIRKLGYRQHVSYQPADRFWPLQWAETALFAFLTLLLAGYCFHHVRRRLS